MEYRRLCCGTATPLLFSLVPCARSRRARAASEPARARACAAHTRATRRRHHAEALALVEPHAAGGDDELGHLALAVAAAQRRHLQHAAGEWRVLARLAHAVRVERQRPALVVDRGAQARDHVSRRRCAGGRSPAEEAQEGTKEAVAGGSLRAPRRRRAGA
jgi:hypothetical protein